MLICVHRLLPFTGHHWEETDFSLFLPPPTVRYLQTLVRSPWAAFAASWRASALSAFPIWQMLLSPSSLGTFARLTPVCPYISCSGEPRNVALPVLSREEGSLSATLLLTQPRGQLALFATRALCQLMFNPVSTKMYRSFSVELLSSQSATSLS